MNMILAVSGILLIVELFGIYMNAPSFYDIGKSLEKIYISRRVNIDDYGSLPLSASFSYDKVLLRRKYESMGGGEQISPFFGVINYSGDTSVVSFKIGVFALIFYITALIYAVIGLLKSELLVCVLPIILAIHATFHYYRMRKIIYQIRDNEARLTASP